MARHPKLFLRAVELISATPADFCKTTSSSMPLYGSCKLLPLDGGVAVEISGKDAARCRLRIFPDSKPTVLALMRVAARDVHGKCECSSRRRRAPLHPQRVLFLTTVTLTTHFTVQIRSVWTVQLGPLKCHTLTHTHTHTHTHTPTHTHTFHDFSSL